LEIVHGRPEKGGGGAGVGERPPEPPRRPATIFLKNKKPAGGMAINLAGFFFFIFIIFVLKAAI